jgi:hypothetical protein
MAPVAFGAAIALVTLSVAFGIVALVLAETVMLVLVPKTTTFRAHIDDRIDSEARAAAADSRVHLLARMADGHAAELTELERLVSAIRAHGPLEPVESTDRSVERALGLERLLESYARLAVAHRRSVAAFPMNRWPIIEAEEAELAAMASSGEHLNDWIARRRSMLAIRRATWVRAREDREAIQHALRMIADVVGWVHELCAVPHDDPGRVALDHVLASCATALRDVRRLEADISFDAKVFDDVVAARAPNMPDAPAEIPPRLLGVPMSCGPQTLSY